jgi:transposase/uncharacterized coiled-coil protein SlyX
LTQEQSRIIELEAQLATQASQLAIQSRQIAELLAQIAILEHKLSQYQAPKDSSNSSIPPSQDPFRVKRTESLREKSGRKPGGQAGHQGCCLAPSMEPTEVVAHQPCSCSHCGEDLSGIPSELIGSRQVIDIPPIKPIITEHQIYGKRCSCGHWTEGQYPLEAHSSVCYGPKVQAMTAYLHARQYIPFERMRELYEDIFGLHISSGSLVHIVESFADKAQVIYQGIRERILQSSVVGADETGTCINGKNRWAWVFQTSLETYIHVNLSRGKKVIDQLFPDGFPQATLVHDCWKSYFGVTAEDHQICVAHLLRDLKYLDKLYPQRQWITDFTAMLHQALDLKKTLSASDYLHPVHKKMLLEEQLDLLLNQPILPEDKKLKTFQERIITYRNYLFSFLYRQDVPADNNASERAVRTFKVKQKVSGLFRSAEGACSFAVIRSVIDTTIKNGKNILEELASIPLLVSDG